MVPSRLPADDPAHDMATRVRALRDDLGLSQEQLAQQLQVSFATVNRWEGGRHRMSAAGRKRFELLEGTREDPAHDKVSTPPTARSEQLAATSLPNLPGMLSSFVGRDAEIGVLVDLVAAQSLVTLTGPAGVGKTRLAAEVSRRLSAELPTDFVALDLIDDHETALGRVKAALGGPASLVVIDGAQHVADRLREEIGRLLSGVSARRVLVTSQQAIGVPGEQVWQVRPLSCPTTDATTDDVLDSEAGRLFVDRAREVAPDRPLADVDAPAIADLCRLVEGLPLAIEILAGWSGMLSLAQIDARHRTLLFPDRPTTATPPDRGVAGLRDVVTASYGLLQPAEQELAQSLSMFAGAFTLDDAVPVAELAESSLLVSLRRLVDSSWLTVEPAQPSNAYRMSNCTRYFAVQQLTRGEQERTVRGRHARHFAELAAASEHGLAGVDRTEWVARMTRAGVDVDAALAWAMHDGDNLLGLEMSAALWLWWLTTGRLSDGRRWVNDFLGRALNPPADLAARAECAAAVLAVESGDYAAAVEHATRAMQGFERLADVDGGARAATALGSAERYLGRQDSARQHFEVALTYRRELGDDRGLASALNNMALLALDGGDLDATRSLFEESLLVKRRLGEPRTVAIGLANLSDVLIRAGAVSQALDSLREAADIAADLADTQLLATIACNLGDAACTQGDDDEAIEHYQTSIDAYRASGGAHDLVPALCGMARALHTLGRTHEAVVRLREAEALSTVSANAEHLAEIRSALSDIGHETTIALPGGLTARQAQILRAVANGASNRSVAETFHISVATVERHLATIYRKLGLHGRVDAARYALKHGLTVAADAEAASPSRPEYMVPRIPN